MFLSQILSNRALCMAWAVAVGVSPTASTAAAVSLESAQMGVPGKTGGVSIAPGGQSVIGWRFEVDVSFQVDYIGGHLLSHDQQPIYGAIIALDSITALPQGLPFNLDEVVASTTFIPPSPSNEILVPLTVTLAPGAYALLFGTDSLGVTGIGAAPNSPAEQPDIPPTTTDSYIIYGIPRLNAPQEWREGLGSNMRLIVRGTTADLPGDYNDDGTVDAADYTVWRDNEGAPAGTLANDADGGVIGAAQYNSWVANFGATASLATSVPEPSGLALLACIAIASQLMASARCHCLACPAK